MPAIDPIGSSAPGPATVVIFGASGDLTARKLVPALFSLWKDGHLPAGLRTVGVARRPKTDEQYREEMFQACRQYSRVQPVESGVFADFARQLHYHQMDFEAPDQYDGLGKRLAEIEGNGSGQTPSAISGHGGRVYYLATLPTQFGLIVRLLADHGLASDPRGQAWARVVIEKPFGSDLDSARALNREILSVLAESQVYRIDHYLGKDTVQNVLSFRFGNAIFEPIFNNRYVDHVQITVAETQGIEAGRGAYYDRSGAMRDMVQNHAMQLLCLMAMEPPAVWGAKEIHDEKVKVLRSLGPRDCGNLDSWAVRGQYGPGEIEGQRVKGYREEDRIDPQSATPTYVALRVEVDNWRWAGVPFLIRTGKRLPRRVTEVAIVFKQPPLQFFQTVECEGDVCDLTQARPNVLAFRIQPDEKISLSLSVKRPGMDINLHPVTMDFVYKSGFPVAIPEAYERLLLDAIRGDSTLFMRSDEVESAWEFITPILQAWDREAPVDFPNYAPGAWGPARSACLFQNLATGWREL
jgi:glucose-6-phosphate 1-dehydrogenase